MKLHFLSFCIIITPCLQSPILAQCSRATMVSNYNSMYLTSAVSTGDLAWTGNSTGCLAGTISTTAQTRTFNRINYYRTLCGLSSVSYDSQYDAACQDAALMMRANNALNHAPPTTWVCYSANGGTAAGNANLALGAQSSTAVDLYMNEAGVGNEAVGHRRWILYPIASKFGHGATTNSDILWVFGTNSNPQNTTFVAYPSAGYFPATLIPNSGRWSFSKNGAIFSSAAVTMTDNAGANVPVSIESIAVGYGLNSIIFKPASIITNSAVDLTYTVNLTNVLVNNTPQNFSYKVIVAQPIHPPACPTGKTWSETNCQCMTTTSIANTIELSSFKGYSEGKSTVLLWSTSTQRLVNRYIVERSVNGKDGFVEIGSVKAAQDFMVERHYNLIDHHPIANSFYRLKTVAPDGKTHFSNIIFIADKTSNSIFVVYPNPNTGKFTLRTNDKNASYCRIMNSLGQVVKQLTLETDETAFDLGNAKPGIYWVEVKAENLLWFQKIQIN